MQKRLYILLCLLFPFTAIGQNYQCLQSGVNRYFTNGLNYLRGMRIDSVKQSGDITIYYPFHTPRGPYLSPNAVLDSTGSSWLGKNVLQYPDGTFVFNNMFDTVFIKTQAAIGDTWIFYSDTTQDYYTATVTAIDTMTVLGSLDTVKTIQLTSYQGANINTADTLNGFQILLSKNHGFVQVFDLYTFPYHAPDATYDQGLDYYLYESALNESSLSISERAIIIFILTPAINPTQMQMNDWQPNDVFEYAYTYSAYNPQTYGYVFYNVTYTIDTIVTRQDYSDSVVYTFKGATTPTPSSIEFTTGSLTYNNQTLFNSAFMPEEYKQPSIYYYAQNDSSHCLQSPLYTFLNNDIHGNTYFGPFEGPVESTEYKIDLGLLSSTDSYASDYFYDQDNNLVFYHKNGVSCGTLTDLAVPDVKQTNNEFKIFPNPANEQLNISVSNNSGLPYDIMLMNIVGEVIYHSTSNNINETIDISNFPADIYVVNIIGVDGYATNQKVIINH